MRAPEIEPSIAGSTLHNYFTKQATSMKQPGYNIYLLTKWSQRLLQGHVLDRALRMLSLLVERRETPDV